jgi:hypothetical protein
MEDTGAVDADRDVLRIAPTFAHALRFVKELFLLG